MDVQVLFVPCMVCCEHSRSNAAAYVNPCQFADAVTNAKLLQIPTIKHMHIKLLTITVHACSCMQKDMTG